jgi:hypothetical protein
VDVNKRSSIPIHTSGGVNTGSFSSFLRWRSLLPGLSTPSISSTHAMEIKEEI